VGEYYDAAVKLMPVSNFDQNLAGRRVTSLSSAAKA
jgi:hypothetical protein